MEEKPTVTIDQSELYNLCSAIGLMTRVFDDWDKEIFADGHDISVPGLMVCVYMLDRSIGGELFKVAWGCFLDVSLKRRILSGTEREVVWPNWDLESLKSPRLTTLFDLAIILSAWNLAAKQDEFPPEMFLGPLFTLSGVIVEGVERGYNLEDERIRSSYEQQRKSLASSHGSEEEFSNALKEQFSSIQDALDSQRKHAQN